MICRDLSKPQFHTRMKNSLISLLLLIAGFHSSPVQAQTDWLDRLDNALVLQSSNGWFRADLSGLADLELYYSDQPPPGLLLTDDDVFFNPRLSLFLDTQFGSHWYGLVQVRADRGFDPGGDVNGDVRFDEYLLRYTPFDDNRLNLQAGKFATIVGNWVSRHDSWVNPFITAPVPYENVIIIGDHAAPPNRAAFLARRSKPDQKPSWLPVLWGPAYTAGAAIFGLTGGIEYALEVKNASISSRPYAWDPDIVGWDAPTVSGRFGYRPNATWNFGVSFSHGAYMLPPAEATLPRGTDRADFNQTTLAHDISYAWRHWQFWGEVFASRFEVPNVGNADTLAYYLEAKYKLTPKLFAALRWNQQLFDKISNGAGGKERWDRDIWRIDTAAGYRFDRHLQLKLQYSFGQQNGAPEQGEHVVAAQFTVKF